MFVLNSLNHRRNSPIGAESMKNSLPPFVLPKVWIKSWKMVDPFLHPLLRPMIQVKNKTLVYWHLEELQ